MEENAEMGFPAILNRNVPLKQDGNEQWKGQQPSVAMEGGEC